jgi:hypothetical protein
MQTFQGLTWGSNRQQVSEATAYVNYLTRLSVREDVTEYCHRESFRTYNAVLPTTRQNFPRFFEACLKFFALFRNFPSFSSLFHAEAWLEKHCTIPTAISRLPKHLKNVLILNYNFPFLFVATVAIQRLGCSRPQNFCITLSPSFSYIDTVCRKTNFTGPRMKTVE